jgi:hypothetical protein
VEDSSAENGMTFSRIEAVCTILFSLPSPRLLHTQRKELKSITSLLVAQAHEFNPKDSGLVNA